MRCIRSVVGFDEICPRLHRFLAVPSAILAAKLVGCGDERFLPPDGIYSGVQSHDRLFVLDFGKPHRDDQEAADFIYRHVVRKRRVSHLPDVQLSVQIQKAAPVNVDNVHGAHRAREARFLILLHHPRDIFALGKLNPAV